VGGLLDHATATLTSERALRMRYLEDLGLRGSPRIAAQLASLVPGAASAPEHLLAQGLNSAGLTNFLVNEPVHGYIADFLDPVRRLILEVDGYRTHGGWVAFQNDRTRQNVLVAHGYTVLRYTAHDVPNPARINPRRDHRYGRPDQPANLMIVETEPRQCKFERSELSCGDHGRRSHSAAGPQAAGAGQLAAAAARLAAAAARLAALDQRNQPAACVAQ
jgi:very-short-patch-repair endonuclease